MENQKVIKIKVVKLKIEKAYILIGINLRYLGESEK